MKTLLLFPPHWSPTQPYLSLPTLASFLRSKGHDVTMRDINVELFNRLLSHDNLQKCHHLLQDKLNSSASREDISSQGIEELKRLFKIESLTPIILEKIEKAKALLRGKESYQAEILRDCSEVVAAALGLATSVYQDLIFTFFLYRDRWNPSRSSEVLQAVADDDNNFFAACFKQFFIADILLERPDIIGISINTSGQVIPGLTLARLIKEAAPQIHITVGGNHFSHIYATLQPEPELFSLIDSLILFEGEVPLLHLIECIAAGKSLHGINNLLFSENSSLHQRRNSNTKTHLPVLAQGIFEELPLAQYFAPEIVFPLQASRGCYWNKCKFCDYTFECHSYKIKSVETFCKELQSLPAYSRIRSFHLVDSAPAPGFLIKLAQELLQSETKANWATMCRFEKQLENYDTVKQLYDSGCRIIEFGLESGSENMLTHIQKGADKGTMKKVLRNCKAAGIFTVAFVIIGFPDETAADTEQTIEFLNELADCLDAVSLSRFALKKHSPFGIEAKKNRQSLWHPSNKSDWNNESEHQCNCQISDTEFQQLYSRLKAIERNKTVPKLLHGTLWDVSYLLLWLSEKQADENRLSS
jgi:anaerobic magnesium-protoporphyrin IX monomethyl ester cyclase